MTSEERGWSAGSRGLRVELLDTELAKAAAEALVRVRSASPVDAIVMASAARRVEQPGSPDGASASADEGLQTNSWFANELMVCKRTHGLQTNHDSQNETGSGDRWPTCARAPPKAKPPV